MYVRAFSEEPQRALNLRNETLLFPSVLSYAYTYGATDSLPPHRIQVKPPIYVVAGRGGGIECFMPRLRCLFCFSDPEHHTMLRVTSKLRCSRGVNIVGSSENETLRKCRQGPGWFAPQAFDAVEP